MNLPTQWALRPSLLLIEPYDEEGLTPNGLWVDHVWEPQAGHAFGRVWMKAARGATADAQAQMAEISIGDLVLFTRAAYIKTTYEGQDFLVVNVEDIQSVLIMEEGDYERYGAACVDG